MEIFIPSHFAVGRNHVIDLNNDVIYLWPHVTNIGNSPNTLNSNHVSIFGPDGMQVTPITRYTNNVFAANRGNMIPGASQEMVIIIPFSGTGDYTIHFSSTFSQAALTLPISRNESAHSRGLVGRWYLDADASDGFYAFDETDFIEFYENGRGIQSRQGATEEFEWRIVLELEIPQITINWVDRRNIVRSEHILEWTRLYLTNSYRTALTPTTVAHPGTDIFIRN